MEEPGARMAWRGNAALCVFLFLLAVLLVPSSASFVIDSPTKFAGKYRAVQVSPWALPSQHPLDTSSPSNLSISETLLANSTLSQYPIIAQAEIVHGRSLAVNGSRNGAIVVYDSDWQGIYLVDLILRCQAENASALVISSGYSEPGRAIWVLQERYNKLAYFREQVRIPVLQVINADLAEFISYVGDNANSNLSFYGTLDEEDMANAFLEASSSSFAIVWQFLLLAFPICGIGFVFYRFIPLVRYEGWKMRLPYVFLALEFLAHSFRIVFAIDPLGSRSLYDPFSVQLLYSPHIALNLICTLVILFYWNGAMHPFGVHSLEKFRRYLYIFVGVFVCVEILSAILRGFELGFFVLLLTQAFYVIAEILIVMFVAYTAFRLFQYYSKMSQIASPSSKRHPDASVKRVLRMTKLVMANAVLFVVIIIIFAVGLLPSSRKVYFEMVGWCVQCTCLSLMGIFETLVLKPIKKPRDKRLIIIDSAAFSTFGGQGSLPTTSTLQEDSQVRALPKKNQHSSDSLENAKSSSGA